MTKPPPRHLPLMLVLAAVGAALGLGFGERWFSLRGANVSRAPAEQQYSGAASLSEQALVYPQPRVLAPFLLQTASGAPLGNPDLRGNWTLVFFGFTHCPDVCPTALATLRQVEALKVSRKLRLPLKYLFVSVDPERDTPPVLGEYAGYFSPAIIAATATPPEVEAFARDVGVVFFKVPQGDAGYTIDHSMQMLLIDPDGNLHAMWRPPHAAPQLLDDIVLIATTRARA